MKPPQSCTVQLVHGTDREAVHPMSPVESLCLEQTANSSMLCSNSCLIFTQARKKWAWTIVLSGHTTAAPDQDAGQDGAFQIPSCWDKAQVQLLGSQLIWVSAGSSLYLCPICPVCHGPGQDSGICSEPGHKTIHENVMRVTHTG